MRLFDTVLITAASERQADAFRGLLARRVEGALYPRELAFEVVSDPPGGRVGTGGGTLWALDRFARTRGADDPSAFLASQRILLIHAGGESRRLPCYAPEGKLFAPLPLPSSALLPPVVLDTQLGLFLKYPWYPGEVVVASGDVVIDFDTALVPQERSTVFGFATPASVEQGSRHGVFRFEPSRGRVVDYLQKAPPDTIRRDALIEGTGDCALDMGLVSLAPEAVAAYMDLGRIPFGGGTLLDGVALGRVRFDLYLEVLTACLPGLSFEAFWERVRGASALTHALARHIYEAFHRFDLGGTVTRSTTFEHVGSLAEFQEASRHLVARRLAPFYEPEPGEIRPFEAKDRVIHNSAGVEIAVTGTAPVLVEGCSESKLTLAGDNLVVGLEGRDLQFEIPRGLIVDERHLDSGRVVIVLSAADSLKIQSDPADITFCGQPLDQWLSAREIPCSDVFDTDDHCDLFNARLFVLNPTSDDLRGYVEPLGSGWTRRFLTAHRLSLGEIQEQDDTMRRDERRARLRLEVLRASFRQGQGWRDVSVPDFVTAFRGPGWAPLLEAWLARTDDDLLRAYRQHSCRAIELAATTVTRPPNIDYIGGGLRVPLRLALKEDQIVWARSSVRLDLAGGWTDTPPYTLRHGGRVVNVAVDLNGQPPIQVFCRRTAERHVRMHSIDLGRSVTFTRFEDLLDYRDPGSPFALPKAALALIGLDGSDDQDGGLPSALEELGSGIEITLLCAVPKGSGLGTSSVLGGVILAALSRFFGRPVLQDELIRQVLQVEQMLTTGGGWQDQIGGLMSGVKYVESRPGLRPHPIVHQLDPFLFQDPASLGCFTLFYTGITRLARNILADVVDRVNGADKAYQFTLRHMAQLALDAKDAIERRDHDAVADVLALSWAANKRIHESTTNEDVEAIVAATAGYVRGVKLLGAGGGGYALFLSEDQRQAETVRDVLRRRFEDERARLVDFSLSTRGLEVSVS